MASSIKEKTASAMFPMMVGIMTIVVMLGGFSYWAMSAEIDGAVVAPGRIIQDRNRQAIQHPVGGVVEEIFVKEGDAVTVNQLLVKLDPTNAQSELNIIEGQLAELKSRRGRLEAERDDAGAISFDAALVELASSNTDVSVIVEGQKRLFKARLNSLEQEVSQLRNQQVQLEKQIEGVDAQVSSVEEQQQLIGSEITVQEQLMKKGLTQQSRLVAMQRERARLNGTKGNLVGRKAEAMEQISELKIQELRLKSERREEAISMLRDIQYNEMEATEQQKTLLNQLEKMDIRAPVAGILYDLKLFGPRSVIRSADPVMYIVPNDRPLLIEAQVEPINVNELFIGQDVVLRFSAFDMRETPDLFGKVMRLSPDAFTDSTTGRAYYRAEIELSVTEMAKLADDQVLIPGMPADTFIKTGQHTPLTYLTDPLTRYFKTAMRDDG